MELSHIYRTTVLVSKDEEFLSFLSKELGIQEDRIVGKTLNKDFYFYDIDLSDLSEIAFSSIRNKLNRTQLRFLDSFPN